MYKTLTIIIALALTGCGHYLTPLGTATARDAAVTPQQQAQDFEQCRDQSRAAVENPQHMALGVAGGLTVVGAPGTIAYLQATRKAVFRNCMEQRGYSVVQQ